MEQVCVSPRNGFIRKTVEDLLQPLKSEVIVLAVRKQAGSTVFNPPGGFEIAPGDYLIVMGERPGLQKLEQILTS